MLRAAGCLLIVTAAVWYGTRLAGELREHVEQLVAMKEMFLMLSGEIAYTRTPLKEAFLQIAEQNKEPFAGFLKEAAKGLEQNEESMGTYWRELVEREKHRFLFSREEENLLKRAGENFGYLDGAMQLKNLELYMEQAEELIKQSRQELKERQKLYRCLSLMCGLFVIILLI